jgi:hypothetical protein
MVTPSNRQFTDDAGMGIEEYSLHQAGRQFRATGAYGDIADADPVRQTSKGVGRKRDVTFVTHDHVTENIFSPQDAIKQSARLAPRNSEDVCGAALEQEFGKMIAGVHREPVGSDSPD